jgi:hypothetical protein
MQLIKLRHCRDYGHEWVVQLITFKHWSIFQSSISWNDYAGWPFIQIKSGNGCGFSLLFWAYKLGIDIDLFANSWSQYYDRKDEGV